MFCGLWYIRFLLHIIIVLHARASACSRVCVHVLISLLQAFYQIWYAYEWLYSGCILVSYLYIRATKLAFFIFDHGHQEDGGFAWESGREDVLLRVECNLVMLIIHLTSAFRDTLTALLAVFFFSGYVSSSILWIIIATLRQLNTSFFKFESYLIVVCVALFEKTVNV